MEYVIQGFPSRYEQLCAAGVGYMLNVGRNQSYMCAHGVACPFLAGGQEGPRIGSGYYKVFAETLEELDAWARYHVKRCGHGCC